MGGVYGASYLNGHVEGKRLVLWSRDGAGRSRRTELPAEWVVYFREGLPQDIERALLSCSDLRGASREDGGWLRFSFSDPWARKALCFQEKNRDGYRNPIIDRGIEHYEGDVDPVRRFLTDGDVSIARPRLAFLDIETDSRVPFSRKEDMRVLSWGIQDRETGQVACDVLAADEDRAEQDLLGALWEALEPYDQVAAWYGDGFDFPVIDARTEQRRLPGDHGRLLRLDHLEVFRRMNMHSAESGEEKQSMSLQSIATAILGEGKDDFDPRHTYEEWAAGGARRARLLRYMLKDVVLLGGIEHKTGYVGLFATICEVCRLFGDTRALNPTQQMDGFLLRLGKERRHHFRSKAYREDAREKFKGAWVMQPKVLDAAWRKQRGMADGIARDVHVADFASLYPSIILTWNMSAETKALDCPVNGPVPLGMCRSPTTGVGFRTDAAGILPTAIAELLRLRREWNDKKASLPPGTPEWHDADRRSMALKVLANSFYGVVGSPFSRYFDRDVAESVAQNGVWLLQHTIHEAEQRAMETIYADTDSSFVMGCSAEQFGQFVDWCNRELYPRLLREVGCKENKIKLAYEKAFARVVWTSAKHYMGAYAHYKGKAATADSKPEVRGLEFKRGDAALLARRLQERAVRMLCGGEERPEAYQQVLAEARRHVLEGVLALEEVKLGKGLNKPLKDYVVKQKKDGTDAATLPHVMVAKILKERGRDVSEGTKIEYVVVDEQCADPARRVVPAEDFQGECDRHYLWQSLVYPPTQRLLEAAFPAQAHAWEQWARSRPEKPRAPKRGGAGEGQADLFTA